MTDKAALMKQMAKFGFCNTVPMMATSGGWGVFDRTKEEFVTKTDFATPDEAIEYYDEVVSPANPHATTARQRGKAFAKKQKEAPKATTKVEKTTKIVRERGGDKQATAKKIFEAHPTMGIKDLIQLCRREMPDVSEANFRYLLTKLGAVAGEKTSKRDQFRKK